MTINFTVAELIAALQNFPGDLPVLVSGYEDGFDNMYEPDTMRVRQVPENMYWSGEFQEAEPDDMTGFNAVLLRRVYRDD